MPSINGLKEIAELYEEIDAAIEYFKNITGLYCIQLCSTCCNVPSENIEASILEVLPLANHLIKTNKLDDSLEKLKGPIDKSVCILYSEKIPSGCGGRCTAYEYRPLVCRLFGHSTRGNKYGKKEIIFCSELKKKNEGCTERFNSIIRARDHVSVLSEYAMRSSMIDPLIGRERFPLNVAIKKAIEFIGLKDSYR